MILQLLQQGGFNPPPPGANNPALAGGALAGGIAAVVCVVVVVLLVFIAPYIFMLVKAMQAMQAVRPRNRTMAPGLVWLGLIPCVNVVMNFLIVLKTTEALDNEFQDRRLPPRGDHGKQLGLAHAVLVVVNAGLSGVSNGLTNALGAGGAAPPGPLIVVVLGVGCLSLALSVVQLVLPIVYGLKLAKSTARLRRDDERYGDDDRDDDDYDDDPSPRPTPKKAANDDFEEYDAPKPRRKPKPDDEFEEFDEPKGGR